MVLPQRATPYAPYAQKMCAGRLNAAAEMWKNVVGPWPLRSLWTECIPVRARAAEEERCELPDDIFGEWMPLLICEKRHVWANKWRTVTTAWLCTPAPGWCRHRCLLQPGGRCLGSGLLLLPPTGAPRLMQRLTVPELGRTAEETVRPRVLPTGDSSAGLPCVGLGRNESGLKKMTKQKKKLKVKNIRASEKRIMYIFSEVLIETWQKLAETISSKFHKIPLRKKWVQVDGIANN